MGSHRSASVRLWMACHKSHQVLIASSKPAWERKTRALKWCIHSHTLNTLALWCTHYCPQKENFQEQRNQGHHWKLYTVLPVTIMLCRGRKSTPKMSASHRAHEHTARSRHCCCPWSSVFSPSRSQPRPQLGIQEYRCQAEPVKGEAIIRPPLQCWGLWVMHLRRLLHSTDALAGTSAWPGPWRGPDNDTCCKYCL